jgi:host factor-I protein
MTKSQLNLQDIFLNQVRKENISVTIYLVNSVQLRGIVRGFDAFTILLDSAGRPTQLVYKHAVTSIVPARPVPNFYAEVQRDAQATGRPRVPVAQGAQPAGPGAAPAATPAAEPPVGPPPTPAEPEQPAE